MLLISWNVAGWNTTVNRIHEHYSTTTGAKKIDICARSNDGPENTLPLNGPGGTVGWLSWAPQTPGGDLRDEVLPVVLLICSAVIGLTVAAAIYFKRLAETLNLAIAKASTDPLTGLLNRAGLEAVLQDTDIERALADGNIALLNIDVDRLDINSG